MFRLAGKDRDAFTPSSQACNPLPNPYLTGEGLLKTLRVLQTKTVVLNHCQTEHPRFRTYANSDEGSASGGPAVEFVS